MYAPETLTTERAWSRVSRGTRAAVNYTGKSADILADVLADIWAGTINGEMLRVRNPYMRKLEVALSGAIDAYFSHDVTSTATEETRQAKERERMAFYAVAETLAESLESAGVDPSDFWAWCQTLIPREHRVGVFVHEYETFRGGVIGDTRTNVVVKLPTAEEIAASEAKKAKRSRRTPRFASNSPSVGIFTPSGGCTVTYDESE